MFAIKLVLRCGELMYNMFLFEENRAKRFALSIMGKYGSGQQIGNNYVNTPYLCFYFERHHNLLQENKVS